MLMFWSGASKDIESHYHDMHLTFPTVEEIPILATYGTKWKYVINARDKEFLSGMFAACSTPTGERAALVLGRNYMEKRTSIAPHAYSMARATNDLSYFILIGRLRLLKYHIPMSPLTLFKNGTESTFCAIKELEEDHDTWIVDPFLKAGMCPHISWLTTITDAQRCWVDIKQLPGIKNILG